MREGWGEARRGRRGFPGEREGSGSPRRRREGSDCPRAWFCPLFADTAVLGVLTFWVFGETLQAYSPVSNISGLTGLGLQSQVTFPLTTPVRTGQALLP